MAFSSVQSRLDAALPVQFTDYNWISLFSFDNSNSKRKKEKKDLKVEKVKLVKRTRGGQGQVPR